MLCADDSTCGSAVCCVLMRVCLDVLCADDSTCGCAVLMRVPIELEVQCSMC